MNSHGNDCMPRTHTGRVGCHRENFCQYLVRKPGETFNGDFSDPCTEKRGKNAHHHPNHHGKDPRAQHGLERMHCLVVTMVAGVMSIFLSFLQYMG